MKMLLRAAFRSGRHFRWLLLSLFTLIGVTFANQIEMFTLGLIINAGHTHEVLEKVRTFVALGDHKMWRIAIALLGVAIFKAIFLFSSRYTTRVLAIKVSRDL